MGRTRIVIDTNVLVSGLRSTRGAAYLLLTKAGELYEPCLSVPLILEYEDVLNRRPPKVPLSRTQIDDVLDYLCSIAVRQDVFFLWRPFLPDPEDDMLLEVAVASGCEQIVTYNTKDFSGIRRFGVEALTPQAFLRSMGALR